MKNRIRKTIVTLLAVIALLIGLMPFAGKRVDAAVTEVVFDSSTWEDEFFGGDSSFTDKDNLVTATVTGDVSFYEYDSCAEFRFFGPSSLSFEASEGNQFTSITINLADSLMSCPANWEAVNRLTWKWTKGGNKATIDVEERTLFRIRSISFVLEPADEPVLTEYPLWVGGKQVTSKYLSNTDEGWSYDPETNVLALNNANITDTHTAHNTQRCISADKDLIISLSGDNTVGSTESSSLAIESYDAVLTITGSGSLTVNSKKDCIDATGKLIIDNTSVTINGYMKVGGGVGFYIINGSEVKATSASGSISVLGPLKIEGSRLEATGDELAVLADRISISGNSEVKAVASSQAQRAIAAICALVSFEINGLEIVTPEDGKIIKGDAGIGREVFTVCDKDGNVAKEVLIKSVTPEYTVTSGAGGTYALDSGKDYTLTVKRNVNDGSCFERFAGVKLDGKELTKDTDYTAEKGSTVITLKASTLSKLSEGKHTITVSFTDGIVETALIVKKTSSPDTPYRIPTTGIE